MQSHSTCSGIDFPRSSRVPRALLLTGLPGVGKTTIVKRVVEGLPVGTIRGFLTEEIRERGQRVGFTIRTFDGMSRTLSPVDIRSPYRVGRYRVDVAALDEVVAAALSIDEATDLTIVDEIGKMECLSDAFRAAIRDLLESRRRLIATVARHGGGFIAEVKRRPDVEVWETTRANRDDMPGRILDRLARG